MTILDTLSDRKLFAALFGSAESWAAWLAFLAAVFGLQMTETQVDVFRRCMGRHPALIPPGSDVEPPRPKMA